MKSPQQLLQETIQREIPISKTIGLAVCAYTESSLLLHAPLMPNINHKDTAFGGSLNAVLTLAGWGLVWLHLLEAGIPGKIVIQESNIRYHRPVTRDFIAQCYQPDPAALRRFLDTLRKRSRARLALEAAIHEDDLLAVAFTARYVVERVSEDGESELGKESNGMIPR